MNFASLMLLFSIFSLSLGSSWALSLKGYQSFWCYRASLDMFFITIIRVSTCHKSHIRMIIIRWFFGIILCFHETCLPVLRVAFFKVLFASLEGKEWEGFKKKSKWKKYMTLRGEGFGDSFFFIIQNLPHLGELKNCIVWGFWRIYMNSSNLIYVVIIFLKLKIY